MKRKDFFELVAPLTDRLYRFAYVLIPDDLQAEQLVIDSFNAYLLKERKRLLKKEIDLSNKKDAQFFRRSHFKGILKYMCEIGSRRSVQLADQLKLSLPEGYTAFFGLEPRIRFVMSLRYDAQFSVEEIEEIVQIPRYEVIEKIHNGRFLLVNNLNKGINV
jgi:DNA-directed RNA polymerase specialized sigma24 family protein